MAPQKGPSLVAMFVLREPTPVVTADGTKRAGQAYKILCAESMELGLKTSSQWEELVLVRGTKRHVNSGARKQIDIFCHVYKEAEKNHIQR